MSTLHSCFANSNYSLIDFGDGQKLERFGDKVVQRQTPSVYGQRDHDFAWPQFDLQWKAESNGGIWIGKPEGEWQARFDQLVFELKPTPTGQLGVFPEQASNWAWIQNAPDISGCKALNLFGYTGGTTMALAAKGAEVVHCDSAKSVVNWARSNAVASGLSEAKIRWMVEDAMTFVEREIKRGNRYDIVVADPPSFGRGTKGESWKIQRDFERLLSGLKQLTESRLKMIVVSCHTPEYDEHKLKRLVETAFGKTGSQAENFTLSIPSESGKLLSSGCCYRWYA